MDLNYKDIISYIAIQVNPVSFYNKSQNRFVKFELSFRALFFFPPFLIFPKHNTNTQFIIYGPW